MDAFSYNRARVYSIPIGIIIAVIMSYLTAYLGLVIPISVIVVGIILTFIFIIFAKPVVGLFSALTYCFLYGILNREVALNFSLNNAIELIYLLVWLVILFKVPRTDVKKINDVTWLFIIWFLISFLQLFNPAGASPRGWLHEIRSSGLDSLLLIPAGFILFKDKNHLKTFLVIVISCSFLATLNGIKQLHFGLSTGENAFLQVNPTHMIWGQLRVFSFYGDAGQFGASQAHLSLICGVLAFSPISILKRIFLIFLSLLFFYGMLISGTRGAFFVLVPGVFMALFLFKKLKIIILGLLFMMCFIAILKYTHIGSSNSYVHRFRSALDPQDASLNVRFMNQEILRDYLKDRPFGGGLGSLGYAAVYNEGRFLSTVAPDSYWVKVWGMYGITGLIYWFSMICYVIGKCCGIVWKIRDRNLRIQLTALTAGAFGIFISSYGNEVINALPSSIVIYLSFCFILLGPKLDTLHTKNEL